MLSNRPVSFGPRSVNVLQSNDENSVAARSNVKNGSDNALNKTPAMSKSRRAFGDISNHRNDTSKGGMPPKTPSLVLKPSKNTAAAKTLTKTVSKNLTNKTATKRRVEFSIPTENLPAAKEESSRTVAKELAGIDPEDPWFLEEPEKPYGRTYLEQLEFDKDDDEETVLSLEGASTLREDWEKMKEQRRKEYSEFREMEMQKQLEDLESQIQMFVKTDGEYM